MGTQDDGLGSAANTAKWERWRLDWRRAGGGCYYVRIGIVALENMESSDRRFDIMNHSGGVILGCEISEGVRRIGNPRNFVEEEYLLFATTPDGWQIELPKDVLLRRCAGASPQKP